MTSDPHVPGELRTAYDWRRRRPLLAAVHAYWPMFLCIAVVSFPIPLAFALLGGLSIRIGVLIALGCLAVPLLIAFLPRLLVSRRSRRLQTVLMRGTPLCLDCGYALKGLDDEPQCPECGRLVDPRVRALLRPPAGATDAPTPGAPTPARSD